jgi:acetyl-CoA carboxylase biotin carboxyl carrier protein
MSAPDRKISQRARRAAGADRNGNREAGTPNTMDLEFLRGLIEAVDSSGIDSLEIHRAGTRIRIAKTPPPAPVTPLVAPSSASANAASPAATIAAEASSQPAAAAPPALAGGDAAAPVVETASNLVDIRSPMVGTFYRAPAPEAPPYVEVGSTVTKGQTLCILEAMKLMNEMESEVDGVIREILADNADPIEYGQVLFRIEPSGSR